MVVTVLGLAAAAWGLLMAVSPALQIRQMLRTRSSRDVSVGYFAVLLPGFVLWVAYGLAREDWAIVVPNAVATCVGGCTVAVASYLRSSVGRPRRRPAGAAGPRGTGVAQ